MIEMLENFEFTYKVPDEYLYTTSVQNKTGTAYYNGPRYQYVFIMPESGLIDLTISPVAKDDANENLQDIITATGKNGERTAVLVDAHEEPIIAWAVQPEVNLVDFNTLPQKEYKLPNDDTVYYSRPEPTTVDHTYEIDEIKYDQVSRTWVKPFPWKKPHMTWAQMNQVIGQVIEQINNEIIENNYTGEKLELMTAYKNEMSNLPTKFTGWDPWQVPFPMHPLAAGPNEDPNPAT